MSSTCGSSRNKHFNNNSSNTGNDQSVDITKEEFSRIRKAFKNEEFRKIFLDYCQEIQDPANRRQFEEEIKQIEAERGVEVTFVNPEPGFVIETSVDGTRKCYINVSECSVIAKPSSEAAVNRETGDRGLNWTIPLAQSGPRDDVDEEDKAPCRVYDVIFHPDALYLAEKNSAFRKCLVDTACDAVEREFHVYLDRVNFKFPKIQFKGIAHPTVIRKLADNPPDNADDPHPLDSIYPEKPRASSEKDDANLLQVTADKQPEFATPKYVLKHRHGVDLSEMTFELDAKLNVTIPRELIVEIELPLLNSTADCQLDVTPKSIYLLSEKQGAKYKLKLDLPFTVNDKNGTARFNFEIRRLVITLPVVREEKECILRDLYREDSGVESDVRGDEMPWKNESPIEELNAIKNGYFSVSKPDENISPDASSIFLKKSIQYQFPQKFDCNILDNVMSFVLHIRNVQAESIATKRSLKSLHLQFSSIGSGYYPTHYSFYLELPVDSNITIDSSEAEAWENNLVLNLNVASNSENLQSYWAGLDDTDLKEYTIQGKFHTTKLTKQQTHQISSSAFEVSVDRSDKEQSIEIEIKPREVLLHDTSIEVKEDDTGIHTASSASSSKKQKKKNKKRRSLSESACDDIISYRKNHQQQHKEKHYSHPTNIVARRNEEESNSSPEREGDIAINQATTTDPMLLAQHTPKQQRKQRSYSECREGNMTRSFKGILKHFSRYDRSGLQISDSCSSIDDHSCSSYSGSIDGAVGSGLMRFAHLFSDIPEERDPRHDDSSGNGYCLSESCKKTVRFNEVIKKQIFRLDSSILGQRKKNQKRKNQKQRALQRRLSEGDSADYEDNKPVSPHSKGEYLKDNKAYNTNHNKNISQHDSGLDLSAESVTCNMNCVNKSKQNRRYHRLESESSSDVESKNSMMFEMDM